MALVCVSASADDGFYVGVGGAYQYVPVWEGTNHSIAPSAELGYNYGYLSFGVAASFYGNMMLSGDINTRFMLTDTFGLILGGGYGAVYRKMKCPEEGCDYESKGFTGWPHLNVGIEVGLTENLGLRVVGAIGYGRYQYDSYNHDYRYDYHSYDYYGYSADEWRVATQVRAALVWNF